MGTSQSSQVQRGPVRMNLRRVESILRRYPDMAEADFMSDRDIITGTPNRVEGMPGGGGVGNPTLSLVMRLESERERMAQVLAVSGVYGGLTGEQRDLVRWCFWEGQTLEAVAQRCGCTYQAVQNRRERILRKFQQAFL